MSANPAVREVALHHTAFLTAKIDRKFCDLGYHFVISPSGRIFLGRPIDRMGAHALKSNQGTIGISLMGDFQEEHPTRAALASIAFVRRRLIPGGLKLPLKGHRDYPGHETNECPGRHLHPYTPRPLALAAAALLGAAPAAISEIVDVLGQEAELRRQLSGEP